MSEVINEDVFESARVNLNNLIFKRICYAKKLSITLIFLF
ncbi:MAG: hypothetical protein CM15mP126_0900 [Gammaproteobacteria bacterium]|nr:MAG: hypothetical protein CM15mP126_0900 [Gammaproteobacteria bacterium]